jgi:hypothetical protein
MKSRVGWAGLPPEELAGYARGELGGCLHPATFGKDPTDYHWHFDPALPTALVRGSAGDDSPEAWRAWLGQEARMLDEAGRGGARYYAEMAAWWLSAPGEPLVVSRHDGLYWAWGGFHRLAISKTHGVVTVPAIVGIPLEPAACP